MVSMPPTFGHGPAGHRPLAGRAGLLVHVMVDSVAATIDVVVVEGGAVAQPISGGGELYAHVRDPAGNVLGLFQQ